MNRVSKHQVGDVYFYHLTHQTVSEALLPLLSKCLSNGWRVVVRGQDLHQLEELDDKLWQGANDSFLPHGLAGSVGAAEQPILLSLEAPPPPHDCLICISGAPILVDEVVQIKRVCIVFQDDNSADMLMARSQWKSLTKAGLAAKYWSQSNGRWELQAEKPAVGDIAYDASS
jgi:DNA polymerase-3 subunit chi